MKTPTNDFYITDAELDDLIAFYFDDSDDRELLDTLTAGRLGSEQGSETTH